MDINFHTAYSRTIANEGGYANNAADRGGETYKGVARKWHPHWGGWPIIDAHKKRTPVPELNLVLAGNFGLQEMVKSFYYENYWLQLYAYNFTLEIACELFDTAVNQGVSTSIRYLQQALNKLNRNQKDYSDMKVDGQWGSKTLAAYGAYFLTSRFSDRNEEKLKFWLLKWLNYYQLKKYDEITNKDLAQEVFVPGWTERLRS